MMAKVWQWDVRRSEDEIRQILENPEHPSFLHYASLLLSRTNVPTWTKSKPGTKLVKGIFVVKLQGPLENHPWKV